MPCAVCGGRVLKTETGEKCMKPNCDSHTAGAVSTMTTCRCGETMAYKGLNQLGEPLYECPGCRKQVAL